MRKAIEEYSPDAVICVGQAGGRSGMTVEKVAVNLMEARIPDNAGNQPFDVPVKEDGETAYFAKLPVKRMVQAMKIIRYRHEYHIRQERLCATILCTVCCI